MAMKRRVALPDVEDSFLKRICSAMDIKPVELAEMLGVPYADVYKMLGPRARIVEIDMDETWLDIVDYVNTQLGLLLAVKDELNRALQKDKTQRAMRYAAALQRGRRSSPRS